MTHIHKVYDTDGHFHINTDTRLVENVSNVIVNPVQYDHNSECMSFDMERYVDGHDMSTCNRVEIIFTNRGTEGTSKGRYIVNDLQISPDDENLVTFTWLIPQAATLYSGTLSFGVRFICTSEAGVLDYAWNTANYTGLTVSKGSGDASSDEIIIYDSLQAGLNAADQSLSAARAALASATASEAVARELLESIPEDYTALSADVERLNDAVHAKLGISGWEWEPGNIANTGENATTTSKTRARTTGYHYLPAGATFSCLSGYSYNVFMYSAEDAGTYITRSTVITTPYTLDRDCYVRVAAGYSPSADITDISQVVNSLSLTVQRYITAEQAENIIDARTYPVIGSPSVYLSDLVDGADYSNTTVQDLYDRYDALCTTYPQWIRRAADLGVASDGSEIRRYEVRLYDPIVSYERHFAVSGDGTYTNYWDSKIQYRRALLNAGAHGEERTACWGLLHYVEDLVKSDEPWALFIRGNYIIDIVPVLNPYGYNRGERTNANGTNINSDFTAEVPDPETQAMIDYLTANKGKLSCIIDCHTTRGNYGYVSTPESSPRMSQLMRLANQIFATCLTSWDEMAAQVGTSSAYTPARPYMYACMAVGVNTVLYYALSHGITDKLLCIETTRPEGVKMGMVTKLTKDCLGNALPALLSM